MRKGFVVINIIRIMSFYWTATVYDKVKGGKFKLKVNEDEIRVFPLDEDWNLGTWLRFHEYVVNNIDPEAEVGTQKENNYE